MWTDTAVIQAAPEVVRRLTLEVQDWPALMPTMQRVDRLEPGPLGLGSSARIKQPGQLPAVWTVTSFDDEGFSWQTRRLAWTMIGSHRFTAGDDAGRSCRNTLTLELRGPGRVVLATLLGPLLRWVLRTENGCFKRAAEGAARG